MLCTTSAVAKHHRHSTTAVDPTTVVDILTCDHQAIQILNNTDAEHATGCTCCIPELFSITPSIKSAFRTPTTPNCPPTQHPPALHGTHLLDQARCGARCLTVRHCVSRHHHEGIAVERFKHSCQHTTVHTRPTAQFTRPTCWPTAQLTQHITVDSLSVDYQLCGTVVAVGTATAVRSQHQHHCQNIG